MLRTQLWRCVCGKWAYATRKAARAAARAVHPGDSGLAAYECTSKPGVFHVGHRPRGVTAGEVSRADVFPPNGLRRSPMPTRRSALERKPIRRARSKRLAGSERVWRVNRAKVLERDGGRCVVCDGLAAEVHHRQPRQMGGSSRSAEVHSPTNLVSLCRGCHGRVESNRVWAEGLGLLVRRGKRSGDTPVMYRGSRVLLTAEFGILAVAQQVSDIPPETTTHNGASGSTPS